MVDYEEIGSYGAEAIGLISSGDLDAGAIDYAFFDRELPALGIQFLPGLYSSSHQDFEATQAIMPDLDQLVLSRTGGVLLNRSWSAGNDQYLFCRNRLDAPQDFDGKHIRTYNAALEDWVDGMGGLPEFHTFDYVYDTMRAGWFDCAITGVIHAYDRRWNEITGYMVGPLVSFPFTFNIISQQAWDSIPDDLQQILLEEAAKTELEALRLASAQNEIGLTEMQRHGMVLVPFSDTVAGRSFNTAVAEYVLPGWIDRVGDVRDPIIADTFNRKVGPMVGLHVEQDSTVVNTRAPRPTATPTVTPPPTPPPPPRPQPTAEPGERLTLAQYAERVAGGPGAIYVGDLRQLEGPAVTADFVDYGWDLGDDQGNVPLSAIREHEWIFESDYYRSLLEKARLTDPTELVSSGERIVIQHACVHSSLSACRHLESWFAPNVAARTNGQVEISVASYPELGISGFGVSDYLRDGALDMAEIYSPYLTERFSLLALQHVWGLWPDSRTHFEVTTRLAPAMERLLMEDTGSPVLMRAWSGGEDQYIFSRQRLRTKSAFRGLKTRSSSAQMSDWLDGIGSQPQFAAFAEVYTALEREIFDAAITSARAAREQRWYEVTDYMTGPLVNFDSSVIAVNKDVWDSIPRDLQQILIEEAARHELESLRLAAVQSVVQEQRAIEAGLELVEFNPSIRLQAFRSVYETVLPRWVSGFHISAPDETEVATFNNVVGPYVGLRIEPDGSIAVVPITEGPHTGRTMEQVLGE